MSVKTVKNENGFTSKAALYKHINTAAAFENITHTKNARFPSIFQVFATVRIRLFKMTKIISTDVVRKKIKNIEKNSMYDSGSPCKHFLHCLKTKYTGTSLSDLMKNIISNVGDNLVCAFTEKDSKEGQTEG